MAPKGLSSASERELQRAPRSHTQRPANELSNTDYLLDILSGKYRVQAISTLAALGIPDLLAERPRTASALASALECEAVALDRLLRFNVGLGFLECLEPEVYSLTSRGEVLRSGDLGPLAAFVGSPEQWDPWSRLRETFAKGSPTPFEATFGTDLYDYLARSPEAAERYDHAIDAFTQEEAQELSRAFDFSDTECLVDVGGGHGKLLHGVLPHWPALRGVLFDCPHVIERARGRLPAPLADRITLLGGDFFEALPQGHDAYCLKHVLHNWDDERAAALLTACADAMRPGGTLLVIEAILTPDSRFDLASVLDLEMSVLTSGRARRKPEFRRLFRSAGLTLDRVQPIGSSWLLVGTR